MSSTPFFGRRPRVGPGPRPTRQTTLAEWRGVDLAPLEKALAVAGRPLTEIVPTVLQNLNLDQRRCAAEVCQAWMHLVDPTVAAHARPAGLHRGTLFVNVDSSVWLDEIVRYRRKEILARLQHAFGKELVTRISFRTG